MDIRKKTLGGLIAIFALVTIALVILSLTVLPDSYRSIESRDVTGDMNQILANIHDEFSRLEATTADYGPWDEMYTFVQGTNPTYPDVNLIPNTYENLRINIIVVTDTRGHVVYARSYNLTDRSIGPLPAGIVREIEKDPSPLRPANTSRASSGFLLVPGTTVMAASHPIIHNDLSGPPAGTLIMGRYLDEKEIVGLGLPSESPPSFVPLSAETAVPGTAAGQADVVEPAVLVRPVSEEIIEGRTLLPDIYGNDSMLLSFQKPRDFYQQGKQTIRFFLLVQLAIMAILGIFVVYRLDRSVLSRLNQVISDTRAVSDGSGTRIRRDGNDEISQLAEAMNTMIGRIEQSHNDLRDSEEKFRSFVQESSDGYVLVGSLGQVIEWNSASERITGITRGEALGTPFIDIQIRLLVPEHRTPEHIELMRKTAAAIIATGEYLQFYRPIEIGIVRPDGTRHILQQTAFPIRVSGQLLFGIINRDISEQRFAEESLALARRKLILLNKVTFQDIRNSVFALSGFHELLAMSVRGPERGNCWRTRPPSSARSTRTSKSRRITRISASALPCGRM